MNQQDRFLSLPDNILFRIFDYHLEFEDTVTVFHVSRAWRYNLHPRLWNWDRLERYQILVPILWDLHIPELQWLTNNYYRGAPAILPLHNPSEEFIDALAHFGSRHQSYHICNYKHQFFYYFMLGWKWDVKKNRMINNEDSKLYVLYTLIISYNVF